MGPRSRRCEGTCRCVEGKAQEEEEEEEEKEEEEKNVMQEGGQEDIQSGEGR